MLLAIIFTGSQTDIDRITAPSTAKSGPSFLNNASNITKAPPAAPKTVMDSVRQRRSAFGPAASKPTASSRLQFSDVVDVFGDVLRQTGSGRGSLNEHVPLVNDGESPSVTKLEIVDAEHLWGERFGPALQRHKIVFQLLFGAMPPDRINSVLRSSESPVLEEMERNSICRHLELKSVEKVALLARHLSATSLAWNAGLDIYSKKNQYFNRVKYRVDVHWRKTRIEYSFNRLYPSPKLGNAFREAAEIWIIFDRKTQAMKRLNEVFKALIPEDDDGARERYPDPNQDSEPEEYRLIQNFREYYDSSKEVASGGGAQSVIRGSLMETVLQVSNNLQDLRRMFDLFACSSVITESGEFPWVQKDSLEPISLPIKDPERLRGMRIGINELREVAKFLIKTESGLQNLDSEALYSRMVSDANDLELLRTQRRPGGLGIDWSTFLEVILNAIHSGRMLLPLPNWDCGTALGMVKSNYSKYILPKKQDDELRQAYKDLGLEEEAQDICDSAYRVWGELPDGQIVRILGGRHDGLNNMDVEANNSHESRKRKSSDADQQQELASASSHRQLRQQLFNPIGIFNPGNRCYQIAVLQVIAHIFRFSLSRLDVHRCNVL
jgi:hypothetical protein